MDVRESISAKKNPNQVLCYFLHRVVAARLAEATTFRSTPVGTYSSLSQSYMSLIFTSHVPRNSTDNLVITEGVRFRGVKTLAVGSVRIEPL
jgi:hypothetical protein